MLSFSTDVCALVQASDRSASCRSRGSRVCAAALVTFESDTVVVVAHDRRNASGPNAFGHHVGRRAGADEIPQAVVSARGD